MKSNSMDVFQKVIGKLKRVEKEKVLYAKAQWELLRRNNKFKKRHKEYQEEQKRKNYPTDSLGVIGNPGALKLHLSFEENIQWHKDFFEKWPRNYEVRLTPWGDSGILPPKDPSKKLSNEELYLSALRFVTACADSPFQNMSRGNYPIYSDCNIRGLTKVFIERGFKVKMEIDMRFSRNQLMKYFEAELDDIILSIKKRGQEVELKDGQMDKKKQWWKQMDKREVGTRTDYRLENYDMYIKAWDMKQKGLTDKEIAEKLMPDDKGWKEVPKSVEKKVRDYRIRAKKLIKNIQFFPF